MPYAMKVKEELGRIIPKRTCCRLAEVAGLAHTLPQHPGDLHLSLRRASLARKVFLCVKGIVPFRPRLVVESQGRVHNYEIAMRDFPGTIEPDDKGIPLRRCCRRAYMRGAFLARGSITDPDRTYHLEIATESLAFARALTEMMEPLGVKAQISNKRRGYVVYVKDGDAIGEFLRLVEAHDALLDWENTRIVKGMKNRVNRLVNAETANVDKTVTASMEQIASITFLTQTVGLESLPHRLRAIARARLEAPYASLAELAESQEPKITKSAANYRLRRLIAMARKLGFKEVNT